MNIEKLSEHFNPADLEWRIQQAGWKKKKTTNGPETEEPWAMVLVYLTSRAVQQRLDEVCGPMNWCNEFRVDPDQAIMCGISIRDPASSEWVTKWDAAEATDIEAIKGGRSGAMKRAAVHWGIGRYLYSLDATFAVCSMSPPPTEEKPLWNKHYDKQTKKGFFWKTPDLPKWALPQQERTNDTTVQTSRSLPAGRR